MLQSAAEVQALLLHVSQLTRLRVSRPPVLASSSLHLAALWTSSLGIVA